MYAIKEKSKKSYRMNAKNNLVLKTYAITERVLFVDKRKKRFEIVKMTRSMKPNVVQRAWIGRRPLNIPGGSLGLNDNDHPNGTGGFHEHIFFEDEDKYDDKNPPNIGFHKKELFTEVDQILLDQYENHQGGFDDEIMRFAVKVNSAAGQYDFLKNNCQDWIRKVIKTYDAYDNDAPHGDRTCLLSGEKKTKAYW